MSVWRAAGSESASRAMSAASSARGSGCGRVSLPPMYMTLSGLLCALIQRSSRCSRFFTASPLLSAPQGLIPAAVAERAVRKREQRAAVPPPGELYVVAVDREQQARCRPDGRERQKREAPA